MRREIQQYDVLWIYPQQLQIPQMPNGFALEVDTFLGWADTDKRFFWVRGPFFNEHGYRDRELTLVISIDQPLAIKRWVGRATPPTHAAPSQEPPSEVTGPDGRHYMRTH